MRKILLTIAVLLLIVVAYFLFWPIPIKPVSWNAPMLPGYVGPHAVNTKLSNLKLIPLGEEEGPESLWGVTASYTRLWPAEIFCA